MTASTAFTTKPTVPLSGDRSRRSEVSGLEQEQVARGKRRR